MNLAFHCCSNNFIEGPKPGSVASVETDSETDSKKDSEEDSEEDSTKDAEDNSLSGFAKTIKLRTLPSSYHLPHIQALLLLITRTPYTYLLS